MIRKIELVAGGEGAAHARSVRDLVNGLFFLHANLGQRGAIRLRRVQAGKVEDLHGGVVTHGVDGRLRGGEIGGRGGEVIVGERVLAAAQFLPDAPRVHHVADVQAACRQVEGGAVLSRARLVRAAGIAQHHGVRAVVVLEEVEDAELLHQPGDEIEIRLPVLHAILQLLVCRGKRGLVIDAPIVQDLLNDLRDRHVMENAAIGVARERPQLGHYLQFIPRHVAVFAGTGEMADDAVEVALRIIRLLDVDGDALADNLREIDGRVFRQRGEMEMEQARDRLVAGEAGEQQLVVAQRAWSAISDGRFVCREA